MSDHYSTADLEKNPLLLSRPRCCNCRSSIFSIIKDAEWCTLFANLSAFAVLSLFLVASIYLILNNPGSQLKSSVFVSSFNVSKNSSGTTWDAQLSANYPLRFFKGLDATAWLYSRNGLVSVSSPSMYYSSEGQEPVLHAIFTTQKDDVEEDFTGDKAVIILDLLVEANATLEANAYGLKIGSFLMIDCDNLKIEFSLNQSFGTLSAGAGKSSCQVRICPTKFDALNGRDKCYTDLLYLMSILCRILSLRSFPGHFHF